VLVAELSGSESIVHIDLSGRTWCRSRRESTPRSWLDGAAAHRCRQSFFFGDDGVSSRRGVMASG